MRVRAIVKGYYGSALRRAGDVFEIAEGDPLGRWMVEVPPDTSASDGHRGMYLGEIVQRQRIAIGPAIKITASPPTAPPAAVPQGVKPMRRPNG